ncbi:hypothetical protein RHMOL_Rhmol06G0197100 [Rhododendron molle]|uniref:Uncharacterized protein n=1 Tax=Rhododendron molle TaxID=49168 RepID=A0ACC0NEZ4_RHOML|nr:hypothetical protein RHMOL_Rhmol06G0197100 [Rhododendron molle]
MDSTPPSRRSRPRLIITSSSRLSRLTHSQSSSSPTPRLTLDLVQSPKMTAAPSPSPSSPTTLPIRELLLLSPCPLRKSKTRLADRLVEAAEEPPAVEPVGSRRKCKNRNGSMGVLVCGSPRNGRRPRRRLEPEVVREERDLGVLEEVGRGRKRRNSGRSKKDKLGSVPSIPSPRTSDGDLCNLDRIGQLVTDLIMWNDAAKSSLWFGFGSLCVLSSCFAKGVSFSIFTLISQLGLLFLGLSFFSSSIYQRVNEENKRDFKLEEDDILRVARVILPPLNLAILKTRGLFSGEPTMTLKVAPILLMGSEYGHLMTLRRLCAIGFFISFTGPKLYSLYCVQIYTKVECLKRRVLEAWRACSHKKIVAASIATAFWNLTSIRTRIFAAFIFVVILRYNRQPLKTKVEEEQEEEEEEVEAKEGKQEQKALVVVENGGTNK